MANIIIGMKAKQRNRRIINEVITQNERAISSNRKDYKPSKWAKDMYSQIKRDTDDKGNYNPSSCFKEQLNSKIKPTPNHAKADIKQKLNQI